MVEGRACEYESEPGGTERERKEGEERERETKEKEN
jgi:hypothetical protein|tara:strand:- start:180 stop:287 length:108 start_codon:yes stop_codon:yes gene_type:complete